MCFAFKVEDLLDRPATCDQLGQCTFCERPVSDVLTDCDEIGDFSGVVLTHLCYGIGAENKRRTFCDLCVAKYSSRVLPLGPRNEDKVGLFSFGPRNEREEAYSWEYLAHSLCPFCTLDDPMFGDRLRLTFAWATETLYDSVRVAEEAKRNEGADFEGAKSNMVEAHTIMDCLDVRFPEERNRQEINRNRQYGWNLFSWQECIVLVECNLYEEFWHKRWGVMHNEW